jgi:FixJ family two-component response regulator
MERTPVWIVDSDHWPRAYLRAELIERGYDAEGFVRVTDLLSRLSLSAVRPALVVVDLRGQELKERDLVGLLSARIPVLAIGGSTEAEDERRRARGWAKFLRRPLTLGEIADQVERLLAKPGP